MFCNTGVKQKRFYLYRGFVYFVLQNKLSFSSRVPFSSSLLFFSFSLISSFVWAFQVLSGNLSFFVCEKKSLHLSCLAFNKILWRESLDPFPNKLFLLREKDMKRTVRVEKKRGGGGWGEKVASERCILGGRKKS